MSAPLHQDSARKTCCYRAVLEPDARFCEECGEALLRCMAFEECGGLLDERGQCPVCVAPAIRLDAGALKGVRMGGVLSLPLIIANLSQVGRPLFVSRLMSRRGGGDYTPVDLSWERLDPGREVRLGVPTGVLEEPGVHQFDFLMTVASRFRWREERFAFETSVTAEVEPEQNSVVHQNIQIDGDMAPGFTFYNPMRVDASQPATWDEASGPMPLPLTRAERFERDEGLRGVGGHDYVPRNVSLQWRGFPKDEAPFDGPIVTEMGILTAGRSRTDLQGGTSDIRLLVRGRDGVLDEGRSAQISRHHFDLFIENDRLMLRVESENGLRVAGEALGRGKTVRLSDGDTISPLVREPGALQLKLAMEAHHGRVETITIIRQSGEG